MFPAAAAMQQQSNMMQLGGGMAAASSFSPHSHNHHSFHGNGGGISKMGNSLMESLKPMLMTMMMVNTANGRGSGAGGANSTWNDLFAMIWSFVAIGIIDSLMAYLPTLLRAVEQFVVQKWNGSALADAAAPLLQPLVTPPATDSDNEDAAATQRVKSASITLLIDLNDNAKSPIPHALVDLLTNSEKTKSVIFSGGMYRLNYFEPIEIGDDVFARLLKSSGGSGAPAAPPPGSENSNAGRQMVARNNGSGGVGGAAAAADARPHIPTQDNNGATAPEYMEVYSYVLNMEELRARIDGITNDYMVRISNKLGNRIYYFDEIPQCVPRIQGGGLDYSKAAPHNVFNMKAFYTNRKFSNLFGSEISRIRKRVEFFRDNKKWYDDKGIPYTLGILMSGQSGAGKTSTIKCLSNELKRHVINVQLSRHTTKSQIDHLFFNEMVHVVRNGKSEQFAIPMNKRIYVIEDVDCQGSDIIYERKLIDKFREQEEKTEQLMKQMSQMQQHPMMVMHGAGAAPGGGMRVPGQQQAPPASGSNPSASNAARVPAAATSADHDDSQKLTLSFLLNILDGVLETPGRIVIMSANYPERLDHALIRPGRFDIIAKFGKCDLNMITDMFAHYYDYSLTPEQTARLAALTEPFLSPAELSKTLFEFFGENADRAIETLESMYAVAQEAREKERAAEAADAAFAAEMERRDAMLAARESSPLEGDPIV